MMSLLAQILDDAVEDRLREDNPARSKRLRVRVPRPERTFLEIDQLVALLDAVGELEAAPRSQKRAKLTAAQAKEIRERLVHGETQHALRIEFGLSSGSMSMLANGRTYRADNGRVGWKAVCATLGYAGTRISEALDLRERDVRLHDPAASRLWVADSKTDTGVRHVEVTPKLRDIMLAHRAQKLRCGYPVEPERPFFCTRKGKRWDEGNVRERVLDAGARLASEKLIANGLPPLPHVTTHTLRPAHLRLGDAHGDELRRAVRAEPGRAHRLQADDGRIRAAARSQQALARRGLRCPALRSTRHPVWSRVRRIWPTIWPTKRILPPGGHFPLIRIWL